MLPHMCRLCAMLSTPSFYHRYCLTWGSSLKDTRKQENCEVGDTGLLSEGDVFGLEHRRGGSVAPAKQMKSRPGAAFSSFFLAARPLMPARGSNVRFRAS